MSFFDDPMRAVGLAFTVLMLVWLVTEIAYAKRRRRTMEQVECLSDMWGTGSHTQAIAILTELKGGRRTVGELVKATGLTKTRVVRLLDELQAGGLVEWHTCQGRGLWELIRTPRKKGAQV